MKRTQNRVMVSGIGYRTLHHDNGHLFVKAGGEWHEVEHWLYNTKEAVQYGINNGFVTVGWFVK